MKYALFLTLALLSASPALAEDTHHHSAPSAIPDAFAQSRIDMHKGMDVKPTGNIDADFVANMIPHHEGALAMAKIELEQGKDPELRKLAEEIIAAQEKEIAFMKEWQKKNAGK